MDEKATISLVIGGWTYTTAFPSTRQNQDTIVCSGQAHFVVEEDDEVIEKELYLEGGDFSRIVAELKDQSRIRECAASIEFEGPVEQGQGHEFAEFHLVLAVEGGSYG